MQYPSVISERIGEPLTTLHGNLEFLQDEHIELMDSKRFEEILQDVHQIINEFHKLEKEHPLPVL